MWKLAVVVQTSESNLCLSYYERECAGICKSESRLEGIWNECLNNPLARLKSGLKGEEDSTTEVEE